VKRIALLSTIALLFSTSVFAATLLDEQFNYPMGMLNDVSGGTWDTWLGTSLDTVVVGGMMVNDGIGYPEVVTYFPNAMPSLSTMNFSFDFFTHEEGQHETDAYVWLGGGTEATLEIDYNIWGFIIDWGIDESPGSTSISVWDVDGVNGGGDYGIPLLAGGLALDTWHTVELIAAQTVADPLANDVSEADGVFQVWVDGVLALDWTNFGNNSANGINSVDTYMSEDPANPEQHDFIALDNLYLGSEAIPEPGTFAMIGAGLLGLLAFRRRK